MYYFNSALIYYNVKFLGVFNEFSFENELLWNMGKKDLHDSKYDFFFFYWKRLPPVLHDFTCVCFYFADGSGWSKCLPAKPLPTGGTLRVQHPHRHSTRLRCQYHKKYAWPFVHRWVFHYHYLKKSKRFSIVFNFHWHQALVLETAKKRIYANWCQY